MTEQRDISCSGWAYQNNHNCKANPIMTAHVIFTLARATKFAKLYDIDDILSTIEKAISDGVSYLEYTFSVIKPYWEFMNTPNLYASIWSLVALKEASETGNIKATTLYKRAHKPVLRYILKKLPRKGCWPIEHFVNEAGATYNKQKNYFSYDATLIPLLLELGISPYEPKIASQIKWLIENKDTGWKITNYDQNYTCSFTYAMLLSTTVIWIEKVGIENAKRLLSKEKRIKNVFYDIFIGPYVFIRTSFLWSAIIFILAIVFLGKLAFSCIHEWVDLALSYVIKNINGIIVNVISHIIITLSAVIIAVVSKTLRGR